MNRNKTFLALFISTIFFGSGCVFAWTGPGDNPPDGNVDTPINLGLSQQIKNGSFGLAGNLAASAAAIANKVFVGSADYNGSLSIGTSSRSGAFQYLDGNQGVGKVLTSDANGNASWKALPSKPATDPNIVLTVSPTNVGTTSGDTGIENGVGDNWKFLVSWTSNTKSCSLMVTPKGGSTLLANDPGLASSVTGRIVPAGVPATDILVRLTCIGTDDVVYEATAFGILPGWYAWMYKRSPYYNNQNFTAGGSGQNVMNVTCKKGKVVSKIFGHCERGVLKCSAGAVGTSQCNIACTGYDGNNDSSYGFVCKNPPPAN